MFNTSIGAIGPSMKILIGSQFWRKIYVFDLEKCNLCKNVNCVEMNLVHTFDFNLFICCGERATAVLRLTCFLQFHNVVCASIPEKVLHVLAVGPGLQQSNLFSLIPQCVCSYSRESPLCWALRSIKGLNAKK